MLKPMVYLSKYNWEPGISGVEISFSIGEKANYRGRDGKLYPVRVESELMRHKDAPGFVRELYFFISPDGPGKFTVDAQRLEPIFTDGEREIKEV